MGKPRWLFIVGAAKCGTTRAAHLLGAHPDVELVQGKEPHYFSEIPEAERRRRDLPRSQDEYLRGFDDPRTRWRLDASTSYLVDDRAPDRVADFTGGDMRAIVLLRDPVARIRSHLLMDRREGLVASRDWDAIVRRDWQSRPKGYFVSSMYVELSDYAPQVARWLSRFGHDRVDVVFLEEVGANFPAWVEEYVTMRLGLSPTGPQGDEAPADVANVGAVARHGMVSRAMALARRHQRITSCYRRWVPERLRRGMRALMFRAAGSNRVRLSPELEAELRAHFAPGNRRLAELIGRPLPSAWIA